MTVVLFSCFLLSVIYTAVTNSISVVFAVGSLYGLYVALWLYDWWLPLINLICDSHTIKRQCIEHKRLYAGKTADCWQPYVTYVLTTM
jgi:hypothetical protein